MQALKSFEEIKEMDKVEFSPVSIEVISFVSKDVITGSNDGEWDED